MSGATKPIRDLAVNQTAEKGPLGLRIIGGFKVLERRAAGLARGRGSSARSTASPADEAEHLVATLKLDPGNYYVHTAIERIAGHQPGAAPAIRVGTFLYALLYLVEGVGLLMRKHWAEYFTVIATGSLIPLEIYEVYRRPTPVRVGVLAINLAIVAYLVYQLSGEAGRRPARGPRRPRRHLTGGS